MRRWLTRILICLVLGAVTTVGVAWGFAVISNQWREDAVTLVLNMLLSGRSPWSVEQQAPRSVVITHETWRAEVPRSETSEGSCFVFIATGSAAGLSQALQIGWPLLALKNTRGCEQIIGLRDAALIACLRIPIWPGFLFDTLFYGAICFGLLFGLGAARRKLRTRRGHCPLCAYDLRGNLANGCPECGWNRQNRSPESRLIW